MTDSTNKYWEGNKNKAVRWYFYAQKGLALFNEFRYLFMLIFGVYYTLRMTHIIWLVIMFAVSLPLLILMGWAYVHHIAKVLDWLSIEFATHWGRYGYDLQEKQNALLKEILEENKKMKEVL